MKTAFRMQAAGAVGSTEPARCRVGIGQLYSRRRVGGRVPGLVCEWCRACRVFFCLRPV